MKHKPQAYAKESEPLKIQDIIYKQGLDRLCRKFRDTVDTDCSEYDMEARDILLRMLV